MSQEAKLEPHPATNQLPAPPQAERPWAAPSTACPAVPAYFFASSTQGQSRTRGSRDPDREDRPLKGWSDYIMARALMSEILQMEQATSIYSRAK